MWYGLLIDFSNSAAYTKHFEYHSIYFRTEKMHIYFSSLFELCGAKVAAAQLSTNLNFSLTLSLNVSLLALEKPLINVILCHNNNNNNTLHNKRQLFCISCFAAYIKIKCILKVSPLVLLCLYVSLAAAVKPTAACFVDHCDWQIPSKCGHDCCVNLYDFYSISFCI